MSGADIVFVGSSPNALAGAARLAASGARVTVLEPGDRIGGPVVTEPFAPGYLGDTGAMSARLDPAIAADLGLEIDVIARTSVTVLGGGHAVTLTQPPSLPKAFGDAVAMMRELHKLPPPAVPFGDPALSAMGKSLLDLGSRDLHEVLRLSLMSARDYVSEVGLSTEEAAFVAGASVRAMSEGPFALGTLLGYLHGEAVGDGFLRATAKGGVGAISSALANKAREEGAVLRTNVGFPLRVSVRDGRATGVVLPNGEALVADKVVSDLDAKLTFTELVPAYEVSPEDNRRIRSYRYRGSAARVLFALRELPRFMSLDEAALAGTLVLAESVEAIERAWDEAKRGAIPAAPYIELAIPTILDQSLAPAGRHVLSAWVAGVPYGVADERLVRDRVIASIARFCPDFERIIEHDRVLLPNALEARFHLTEGHLYGGELNLAQVFFQRPLPGYGGYGAPIEGLHLGGSAAHPGGYSGRSGWSLAGLLMKG